jgi:DNA-binding HxlR family transcriptional regulator
MDRKILDIVSNKYLTEKVQLELEMERLINNTYPISVEEAINRLTETTNQLSSVIRSIQMWENIISQIVPQEPEKEK